MIEPGAHAAPTPHAKLRGVWVYLAILATVYAVGSLALGITAYQASQNKAGRSSSYSATRTTTSATSRHIRAAPFAKAATPTASRASSESVILASDPGTRDAFARPHGRGNAYASAQGQSVDSSANGGRPGRGNRGRPARVPVRADSVGLA
jgi:hypothetical protein